MTRRDLTLPIRVLIYAVWAFPEHLAWILQNWVIHLPTARPADRAKAIEARARIKAAIDRKADRWLA